MASNCRAIFTVTGQFLCSLCDKRDVAIIHHDAGHPYFGQQCDSVLRGHKTRCGCRAKLPNTYFIAKPEDLSKTQEIGVVKPRACENTRGTPASVHSIGSQNKLNNDE